MAADHDSTPETRRRIMPYLAAAGGAALLFPLVIWRRWFKSPKTNFPSDSDVAAQHAVPLPDEAPVPQLPEAVESLSDLSRTSAGSLARPVVRWLMFLAVTAAVILALYALPGGRSGPVFAALVIGSLLLAAVSERKRFFDLGVEGVQTLVTVYRTSHLPLNWVYDKPLSLVLAAAEIGVIVVVALLVTSEYRRDNPRLKLNGLEAEWLTSSAYMASNSLRDYGYIPLWQPYLEFGEPLIDQPFSFVLNPISTLPSLLYGGVQGIKTSVVLTVILAGVGGWFMGRVLGFGMLARVLLGLLMIGKGNMQAMIGMGYFQLGVTQAYFPWIIGGTIAILRLPKRWPVVLTAVMFTLMFWGGNIWYTLPVLLSMAALAVAHLFDFGGKAIRSGLGRLVMAGLLTLGLSAITFLPLFGQMDVAVGGHYDEKLHDEMIDLDFVVGQYFDGSLQPYYDKVAPGGPQFYYSFITPLWFVVLIFVIIPPIWPYLHRPGIAGGSRIWIPGLILILFCTSWGAGGNSVFVWLYKTVPLLGQWRFVGRALAMASFWIAVLVAMRVDGLWRALLALNWRWMGAHFNTGLKLALVGLLSAVSLYTGYLVNSRWDETAPLEAVNEYDNVCIDWLREQYPDKEMAVYLFGYHAVTTFIDNKVRLFNIEADYFPLHMETTLGHFFLRGFDSMPEFALAWTAIDRHYLSGEGYYPLLDSPVFGDIYPCVWRNPNTFTYAYKMALDFVLTTYAVEPEDVTPITTFERKPDQITLWVTPNDEQPLVVTIQELAYPGWQVSIEDEPAVLEVVGGQVGVQLPPSVVPRPHEIVFRYRPPLLFRGAAITLLTWAFCILYLLRAGRILPILWRRLRQK